MNHPLFNPALEERRKEIIRINEKIKRAYPDFCACVEFMIYTGIRPSELWLIEEMELTMSGDIYFTPRKNNNPRTITNPMAVRIYGEERDKIIRFTRERSIQDLSRLVSRYFGSSIDFDHGRGTVLYIFRYMYVNHLVLCGKGKAAIQHEMGHKEMESTDKYFMSITAAKYKI